MGQTHATSIRESLDAIAATTYDLVIIGGGITGAGIARDATMRGLTVALLEARDFGAGTSSHSSRLIHGGLRYLEHYRWHLVFEALAERRVLLRIAPHLVHPLAFVLPVFRGDRVPRWKLALGLTCYDLLALRGNVRRHSLFGKRALLTREPFLRSSGLTGGGLYWDAQCDDARLVLATVRAAAGYGAVVRNYAAVSDLVHEDGRVGGVRIVDQLDGSTATIRASVVINATGPWTDRIRRMEHLDAAPLLRPTKGVHVMVRRERIGHRHGITFTSPIDGRVMFVLPWGDRSYIGTTDTDADDPDVVGVDAEDIEYLLRSVNALFPAAHLGEEDIVASWAGLRPLLAGDPSVPTSAVSREHRVLTGPGRMITVAGGKLTTYRRMAAETVDQAVQLLPAGPTSRQARRPPTDRVPLPGGESPAPTLFREAALDVGLDAECADHLVRHHGAETPAVANLVRERPDLKARIHPEHPAIAAEVVFAAEREYALRVEDVLVRRLHLHYETDDRGYGAAETVAELLGAVYGWDGDRMGAEVARYADLLAPTAAGSVT